MAEKSRIRKAQLGAIGENMVAVRLLQNGWDAIMANQSINNCQSYDIVCIDPDTGKTALVQVKTSFGNNIPVGMRLEDCTMENLKKKIIGPWVFVHVSGEGESMTFDYYVLSREEIIKLIYESNDWYVNKWHRGDRTIDLKNACGVKIIWLDGKGEEDNEKHVAFINPLNGSAKIPNVTWQKIFED